MCRAAAMRENIVTLAVRGTGDPTLLIEPVQAEIRRSDPNVLLFEVNTMDDVQPLSARRFFPWDSVDSVATVWRFSLGRRPHRGSFRLTSMFMPRRRRCDTPSEHLPPKGVLELA